MVISKKQLKESALPSVQEVREAELEQESSQSGSHQLGGIASRPWKAFSRGSTDTKTVSRSDKAHSPTERASAGPKEEAEEDSPAEQEGEDPQGAKSRESSEEEATNQEEEWDTDLEIDDAKQPRYSTVKTLYEEACKIFAVVPASYFLRHMHDQELNLMHHGLGPQGAKALSVPLVTNTSVLNLNLSDNWLGGGGGVAIAEMLKENCYITGIDLSDNKLGLAGAQAISAMLKENVTLVNINLCGNEFDDHAATPLAEAFMSNHKVQSIDLSHNLMGEGAGTARQLLWGLHTAVNLAGEVLGNAIAENTGMKELNLSWNCFREMGSIPIAKGLGANIFLRAVDLSYNGFGKTGAAALGEALKVNNVLEHLNVSNNRIPPEGAVRFATGLKENKTLKTLNFSRNPMQSAGCYGIIKSMQGNPESAIEFLDFSDITVNKDFDDLHTSVKEMFPHLKVIHGGNTDEFRKTKAKHSPTQLSGPLYKLKQHMKENSLNLVDFFERVDKDKSAVVTRREFEQGLVGAGIPSSKGELQQLMDTLDKEKNGEIDLSELNKLLMSD
ncbi:leucine-rich repeat-containing protein 74B-like isoform X2 [Acipenser ruthenus]|uniref:leucine-rich repeat-containing protein 74B-like isoform X2 n=1 Tax=Acipenser ruthenus TaxID=7906 RepID=UPI002741FC59|nr:leucine-rich repeat-containing protein 74B-like isoform X2 [Acipenser ruthenus]